MSQILSTDFPLQLLLILSVFFIPESQNTAEILMFDEARPEIVVYAKREENGFGLYQSKQHKKKIMHISEKNGLWTFHVDQKTESFKAIELPNIKDKEQKVVKIKHFDVEFSQKGSYRMIRPIKNKKGVNKWVILR